MEGFDAVEAMPPEFRQIEVGKTMTGMRENSDAAGTMDQVEGLSIIDGLLGHIGRAPVSKISRKSTPQTRYDTFHHERPRNMRPPGHGIPHDFVYIRMTKIHPQTLQPVDHFVHAPPPHIHHERLVVRPYVRRGIDLISQHMNFAVITPGAEFNPRHELEAKTLSLCSRLLEARYGVMIGDRETPNVRRRCFADDLRGC